MAGNVSRVLASDLTQLQNFLKQNFNYDPGSFDPQDDDTPQKRLMIRSDLNINNNNKINFGWIQLDSSSNNYLSGSASAGIGRPTFTSNFMAFSGSNYTILENIKSTVGEWNSTIGGSMANSLIVGYTSQDESRGPIDTLFPFVDILNNATTYTSFGSEPFTPNNELRYNTFQLQDSFTKYTSRHTITFGASFERYRSENVFFPGKQSAYVYNSLNDFFTDLNGYLANPNRTTSPVSSFWQISSPPS